MQHHRFLLSNPLTRIGHLFSNKYKFSTLSHIQSHNKKKRCFIFPGMGSQYTGMCKDLYNDYKYIKIFLEECDELLGFSISNIMFNAEPKELQQPQFSGTSIFIHSMCIWKILETEYNIDNILCDNNSTVIGHSTGEYSALTVVNVFKTFQDALHITNFYTQCMQECSSSNQAMYAIISDNDINIKLLQETVNKYQVDIANMNTPTQIIISGIKSNIDYVISDFNNNLRGRYLQTGGAYHSRFMKPVSQKLQNEFNSVELNDELKCDLYLNVIGNKYNNHCIGSIMSQQIYDQVLWHQCIKNYMICNDINNKENDNEYHFIEIGPKKVLQKLVQSICKYHGYDEKKNINIISIDTSKHIELIESVL